MKQPPSSERVLRFGVFEANLIRPELRKRGLRVRIQEQPFEVLKALLENPGEVVTRDELIGRLWTDGSVVDFDRGLNAAITRLRQVLSDSAETPRYIETVARRGYRFIAPVHDATSGANSSPALLPSPLALSIGRFWPGGALLLVSTAVVILATWLALGRDGRVPEKAISLVRLTSDPGLAMTPSVSVDGKLIAYASDRDGEGNLHIWVRHVGGAEAIRLTRHPADDYDPSFSPDGRRIAFRSEREGGGIYEVSALGGEEKRIAPLGRRPKFSPDGKWIAYWVGASTAGFLAPGSAKMYVVPSTGGTPGEIRSDFAAAGFPIWTPDSKHLLFLGNRDAQTLAEPGGPAVAGKTSVDWWVTPIGAGPAIATGANAAFRALGFAALSQIPTDWFADGQSVLMSGTLANTTNVWRVPISPKSWSVSGTLQRITSGTTMEVQPSAGAQKDVAFASLNENLNIWNLPMDPNAAKPTGELQRLTQDPEPQTYPAVSADGRSLAFSSRRSGNRNIWLKEFMTGRETSVAAVAAPGFSPAFSPDAGKLAFRVVEKQAQAIYVATLATGAIERVCEDCGGNGGWSSDGKALLYTAQSPPRISMLDLISGQRTVLVTHPEQVLHQPYFSPDNRWLCFNVTTVERSRIFVAPVRRTSAVSEPEWIGITNDRWDDKPRWSPDGNVLYFVSERDGFRCIWAQRLDRASKHPLGPPIAIFHAHEARRSLGYVGWGDLQISVARDRIVFNVGERTGNIWMAKREANR